MTPNGHESDKPLRAGDPRELDGYRVVSRLGRGGMGTVYLAEDQNGRSVAIKLIHPDLADDESFRRRFAREVDAARRVARFSTAGVIDARLDGEPLFIVSEYVAGPNLYEAVRTGGPMHGGTLEGLAMGVAAALTAIHGSGVIHRDLKPANVLLSTVGPKVIDFGIARALDDSGGGITRSSQLMGTPSYMAPELILGEQPTPAADIFAWGCLVTFAGTGNAPFNAATVPAVLHNISTAAPKLDGLDPSLLDLVEAALDKKPGNRPTSQQILARLTGQEDPEEAEVRRTITTSWAPPTSAPVAGAPPEEEIAAEPSQTWEQPQGVGPHQGTTPNQGAEQGRIAATEQTFSRQPTPPSTLPFPPGHPGFQAPSGPQNPSGGQHPGAYGVRTPPPHSGPQQGQGPYTGPTPPGGHGRRWPDAGHPPNAHPHPHMGRQGPSPVHGQPALGTHAAPTGPGGPGGFEPPVKGGASGGRRRFMLIGGGMAALVLVAAVGGSLVFSGTEGPPEDTTSLYVSDFTTDPGWPRTYDFDPQDPGLNNIGYWGEQGAMVLTFDASRSDGQGARVPYEPATPDHVLISTTMAPLEGPAEATTGAYCWGQESEEDTMYEAQVRLDGGEAQIRRVTETAGESALARTTEVDGFVPYGLFGEDAPPRDLPYRTDLDELDTNNLKFACEYTAEDGQDPYMRLRLWVNDELVLSATDEEPLPDDSDLDDDERRMVGLIQRSSVGNEQVAVAYTDFALHRINVEE
ncbi:serine/threonine-protein kinase [Nocardiopsis alkaliphila]|uniref:serine/threonine-protein kinase n=1 Tax=Nocardiopsis alkaliphila TaxID=225762 RepID=UPI00034BEF4D|nr:serine/threonine-protein kinase [Nocardiopsis alkaliphila]